MDIMEHKWTICSYILHLSLIVANQVNGNTKIRFNILKVDFRLKKCLGFFGPFFV